VIEERYYADHRPEPSQLHDAMRSMSASVKNQTIAPLFADVTPYFGYRCLAALAKHRKVIVVTLAWDSALADACAGAGVQHRSLAISDGDHRAITRAIRDDEVQLVCLHLHGKLEGDRPIRFEHFPAFQPATNSELLDLGAALDNLAAVVGVPLHGGEELMSFYERTNTSHLTIMGGKVWSFARDETAHDFHEDTYRRTSEPARQLHERLSRTPDVDFDRLMMTVGEAVLHEPYARLRSGSAPPPEELVLPKPSLLRSALDAPVVVLPGQPSLGKTTVANVLGHLARICDKSVLVTTSSGASAAASRLSVEASSELGRRVHILDDAFATSDDRLREQVLRGLMAYAGDPGGAQFIVTSQLAPWYRAIESVESMEGLHIVSARASDWYSAEMLGAVAMTMNAQRVDLRDAILERVTLGELSTPARLAEFSAGLTFNHDDAVVADKFALLKRAWAAGPHRDVALYLAIVRLQELSPGALSASDLEGLLGSTLPEWAKTATDAFLASHSFDGVEYLRLAHHTDRVALDRFLLARSTEIESELLARGCPRKWVSSAILTWQASCHLLDSADKASALAKSNPWWIDLMLEWGPEMLADLTRRDPARGREALEYLAAQPHDFWSRRELIYQVVRDWDALNAPDRRARNFVGDVLSTHGEDADRPPMGCYSMLEACLYLQNATPHYLRTATLAALEERVEDAKSPGVSPETLAEVGLAFDALLWRRPPIDTGQLHHLIAEVSIAAGCNPALAGALAAASLFHGVERVLASGARNPVDMVVRGDHAQAEAAAELVRWHFLHQSRGRALFNRRLLESERTGYLDRLPSDRVLRREHVAQIERALHALGGVPGAAGWIFHLGLNLRCTTGVFDCRELRSLLAEAPLADDGILTAAMTYEAPRELAGALKDYCRKRPSRERLQELMGAGVPVGFVNSTTHASGHRFRFSTSADETWLRLGLRSEAADRFCDSHRPSAMAAAVDVALVNLRRDQPVDEETADQLVRLVAAGDLRILDQTASRREGAGGLEEVVALALDELKAARG